MKKAMICLLFLAFPHCAILGVLDFLNVAGSVSSIYSSMETGEKAAGRITEAAILADLIRTGSQGQLNVSILSLLADKLLGIKEGNLYPKEDVDQCVQDIMIFGLYFDAGGVAIALCDQL